MYKWINQDIDINQINSKWNVPEYKIVDGKIHKLLKFYKTWYPDQYLNEIEYSYILSISKVFKVRNPEKKWIRYLPTSHQIEWHRYDNVCLDMQGKPAIHRVAIKSRNTSFTVSSSISSALSCAEYGPNIVPLVKINETRAFDLIKERLDIILNIEPIELKNGSYWPYDPTKLNLSRSTEIGFPNGTVMRGFPANAVDAIRGERSTANADLDETNFVQRFGQLYSAAVAANAGIGDKGYSTYQINIGTTLQGKATNFYLWLENIMQIIETLINEGKDPNKILGIKIFYWPIFDPNKFNPEIPIPQQPELIPLVQWQNVDELEKERRSNLSRFLEEYMAEVMDKTGQLYPNALIESVIDPKLQNFITPPQTTNRMFMGVDVAGGEGGDFFSISIFEEVMEKELNVIMDKEGKLIDNEIIVPHYYQRHLYLEKNVQLPEMERITANYLRTWPITMCKIDKGGNGAQITQSLTKQFPNTVQAVNSTNKITIDAKEGSRIIKATIPVKEYLHTQQIYLMNYGRMHLLNNELQKRQYATWDQKYESTRTKELGHGDSTISNGFCIMPADFKVNNSPLVMGGTLHNGEKYVRTDTTQNVEDNGIVSGFRVKKRIGVRKWN